MCFAEQVEGVKDGQRVDCGLNKNGVRHIRVLGWFVWAEVGSDKVEWIGLGVV